MIIFYRNDLQVIQSEMPLAAAKKTIKYLRRITTDRWHLSAKFIAKNACTFVFGKNL